MDYDSLIDRQDARTQHVLGKFFCCFPLSFSVLGHFYQLFKYLLNVFCALRFLELEHTEDEDFRARHGGMWSHKTLKREDCKLRQASKNHFIIYFKDFNLYICMDFFCMCVQVPSGGQKRVLTHGA